jgi:hypothetical protein
VINAKHIFYGKNMQYKMGILVNKMHSENGGNLFSSGGSDRLNFTCESLWARFG